MIESKPFILMRSYLIKLHRTLFGCLFFLLIHAEVKCQFSYQDSIRNLIRNAVDDKQKLAALLLLGSDRNSLHADSIQLYAAETKRLATILNDENAMLEALLMEGSMWNKKGEGKRAIELAEREIVKEYSTPQLRHTQRKFYLLKGFVLNVSNKPKEAQETFFTVLAKAENENDLTVQAVALNGIGWSYHNLNNIEDAIEWYKKGLALINRSDLSIRANRELVAVLQSNIGLAYYTIYKSSGNVKFADSTDVYLDVAITSSRQNEFIGILAISIGTKALLIHKNSANTVEAENMLQEAINLRIKLGQLYFIITDMGKLGELYFQTGNYQKSILSCKEAIRLSDSSGIKSDIIYLYEVLAKSLRANKQYMEYGDILATQIRIQDSIDKVNSAASLNELTTRYETQKKEALIAKQEYSLFRRKVLIYIVVIIAVFILAVVFIRIRKLKRQQKEQLITIKEEEKIKLEVKSKQARERERERIISDLHDDIGATLSSMSIYSDLASNVIESKPNESKALVDKISGTSKELMNRMGDIIWSMKPADEDKYTVEARLKNYCNELLAPKNIFCEFDIDATLAASITNPEVRKNILLIAKEAINNIAKYSEATKSIIGLKTENDIAVFSIQDNGKGFETLQIKQGNGLANMEQRCKVIGGKIQVSSNAGKGVHIICHLPIANISHTG